MAKRATSRNILFEIQIPEFEPRADCKGLYKNNYQGGILAHMWEPGIDYKELIKTFRNLILTDLFFILYFVMRIKIANHPFVVRACREVEDGPKTNTLDLWARGHFKTSILTIARVIQRVLDNPEERVLILGYKFGVSKEFLFLIRSLLGTNSLLLLCFPDVLEKSPATDSERWSSEGLIVKRKGSYKEPTIMAAGLIEGMPTGMHYTLIVIDDAMTEDFARNPVMIQQVCKAFDTSMNLKSYECDIWILGTHYNHEDVYVYIERKTWPDGTPLWHVRRKPGTVDGTRMGASVFLSEADMDILRAGDPYVFSCQQLLLPNLKENSTFDGDMVREIRKADLPHDLYVVIAIDPAGEGKTSTAARPASSWAIMAVGIDVFANRSTSGTDLSGSKFYILDMFEEKCKIPEGIDTAISMMNNYPTLRHLIVEKVGWTSMEYSISQEFLKRYGRQMTEDRGQLILYQSKVNKDERISFNLSVPVRNGNIFMVDSISPIYKGQLRTELNHFPNSPQKDLLDALSMIVGTMYTQTPLKDTITNYKRVATEMFHSSTAQREPEVDTWGLAY